MLDVFTLESKSFPFAPSFILVCLFYVDILTLGLGGWRGKICICGVFTVVIVSIGVVCVNQNYINVAQDFQCICQVKKMCIYIYKSEVIVKKVNH